LLAKVYCHALVLRIIKKELLPEGYTMAKRLAKRRAAKKAGKRRPLKKIVVRAKAGAKKRQARRVKRRETVVEKVKHMIGMK
jgi:hypothetical protein